MWGKAVPSRGDWPPDVKCSDRPHAFILPYKPEVIRCPQQRFGFVSITISLENVGGDRWIIARYNAITCKQAFAFVFPRSIYSCMQILDIPKLQQEAEHYRFSLSNRCALFAEKTPSCMRRIWLLPRESHLTVHSLEGPLVSRWTSLSWWLSCSSCPTRCG